MSEELKGGGAAPAEASGQGQETQEQVASGDGAVNYNTYAKTLDQEKRAKARVKELEAKMADLHQQKLEAEGKKDELIASLKERAAKAEGNLKHAVGGLAKDRAYEMMLSEAMKVGLSASPQSFRRFVEMDLESLRYDENTLRPDEDEIKGLVEKYRQQEAFLFSQEAPKVAHHKMSPGLPQEPTKSLGDLKDDELMEAWKKQL